MTGRSDHMRRHPPIRHHRIRSSITSHTSHEAAQATPRNEPSTSYGWLILDIACNLSQSVIRYPGATPWLNGSLFLEVPNDLSPDTRRRLHGFRPRVAGKKNSFSSAHKLGINYQHQVTKTPGQVKPKSDFFSDVTGSGGYSSMVGLCQKPIMDWSPYA